MSDTVDSLRAELRLLREQIRQRELYAPKFAKTYIVVDVDGDIREQNYRGTEAYLSVIEDILGAQVEAARVFKLHNGDITDVTEAIVDEVYSHVRNSADDYIPHFLKEHLDRESYNVLCAAKTHPAQRKFERAEDAADRAHDERCAA